MKNLDQEQYRILLKRITKAIHGARYEPAKFKDEGAEAAEVLRPYVTHPPTTEEV
jgi:hypothetical protein